MNGVNGTSAPSLNSLKRWSCSDHELPAIDKVRNIHVYDFDNTLFASPLPNKHLWHHEAIGLLSSQEVFTSGGWWHDAALLAATGQGVEEEEKKGYAGWWNESVVNLVQLSSDQAKSQGDTVSVLLTGRNETKFAGLVKRILASRKLDFHLICLRPEVGPSNAKFSSTMKFKQAFLTQLIDTYKNASEFRIYEDRVHHVKAFRQFLDGINDNLKSVADPPRRPFDAQVIEISENVTTLDPTTEVAEVQRMINTHNIALREGRAPPGAKPRVISKTVFYTGYLVAPDDTKRLLAAARLPEKSDPDDELRILANTIMICFRPAAKNILDKVGGMGNKVRWRADATGSFDNRAWAMRVKPVPSSTAVHFEGGQPMIVLALRRNARPYDAHRIVNWNKLDGQFEFVTTVGEKTLLRIEEEKLPGNTPQKKNNSATAKRTYDEDFPSLNTPQAETKKPPTGPSAGNFRGGSQRGRGGRHAPANANRGGRGQGRRGGRGAYRSLDTPRGGGAGAGGGHRGGAGTDPSTGDGGLSY